MKVNKIINKGTGAGGSKTNLYGKKFELDTSNELYLNTQDYKKIIFDKSKYGYGLYKKNTNYEIYYINQNGLNVIFNKYFKLNKDVYRKPDEAYIIIKDDKINIKILEKKVQNVEGSVEEKLWLGPIIKRDYELIFGENININFAYCVNNFLKNKFNSNKTKYNNLLKIYNENNIKLFYGEDEDYLIKVNEWINKI